MRKVQGVTVDDVHIYLGAVAELASRLGSASASLSAQVGGVDRAVPAVPEDEHGVGLLLVALDEARERLDRHVADVVREAGRYLEATAQGAHAADAFVAPAGRP